MLVITTVISSNILINHGYVSSLTMDMHTNVIIYHSISISATFNQKYYTDLMLFTFYVSSIEAPYIVILQRSS